MKLINTHFFTRKLALPEVEGIRRKMRLVALSQGRQVKKESSIGKGWIWFLAAALYALYSWAVYTSPLWGKP